jgi:NTP pyrophosphatase (non-canonical NTP hydrolase)
MADAVATVAELKDAIRQFVAEREWEPFHSPKNLSMSLAVEAAELMEHFLWVDSEASRRLVEDPAKRGEVADEVADVGCLLLNFSIVLGLDLSEAIRNKMAMNALKYPVEKYRGRYEVDG